MYAYFITRGFHASLDALELQNPAWLQSGNDLFVCVTKQLECQLCATMHSCIQYLPLCLLLKEKLMHCFLQLQLNCDKSIICDR